jgi:hypothetical protein
MGEVKFQTLEEAVAAARARRSKQVDWYEFIDVETGLCALCGNTGILRVESLNPMRTLRLGYEGPCVCPNGRSIKKGVTSAARTWSGKP